MKIARSFVTPSILVLSFLVAAPTRPAAAPAEQRALDRRTAIHLALAQNPRVAAARAEEAVLVAQRHQVDAARFPIVALDAGVGPSVKATLVPGTAVQSVEKAYGGFTGSDLSAVAGSGARRCRATSRKNASLGSVHLLT